MNGNPLELIKKLDSELFENITQARELAFKEGVLAIKDKLLIALALDAALGAENGVRTLTKQAIKQGATQEEIMETLRVVRYIAGVGSMYTAAAALEEIF